MVPKRTTFGIRERSSARSSVSRDFPIMNVTHYNTSPKQHHKITAVSMNQNDSKVMVCTPLTEFIIFITLYYKQYILPCYQEEFKALKAKVEEME